MKKEIAELGFKVYVYSPKTGTVEVGNPVLLEEPLQGKEGFYNHYVVGEVYGMRSVWPLLDIQKIATPDGKNYLMAEDVGRAFKGIMNGAKTYKEIDAFNNDSPNFHPMPLEYIVVNRFPRRADIRLKTFTFIKIGGFCRFVNGEAWINKDNRDYVKEGFYDYTISRTFDLVKFDDGRYLPVSEVLKNKDKYPCLFKIETSSYFSDVKIQPDEGIKGKPRPDGKEMPSAGIHAEQYYYEIPNVTFLEKKVYYPNSDNTGYSFYYTHVVEGFVDGKHVSIDISDVDAIRLTDGYLEKREIEKSFKALMHGCTTFKEIVRFNDETKTSGVEYHAVPVSFTHIGSKNVMLKNMFFVWVISSSLQVYGITHDGLHRNYFVVVNRDFITFDNGESYPVSYLLNNREYDYLFFKRSSSEEPIEDKIKDCEAA